MEFFYFQSKKKKLFGIYHPPVSEIQRIGVVLCNPLGQEHIRCYYAILELANKLSKMGFHVLRFDYSGTGESEGDFKDLSINNLMCDIETAIEEIKTGTQIEKIYLVGLRLGAALAFKASLKLPIDAIVMWSPILNGEKHLKELKSINSFYTQNWLNDNNEKSLPTNDSFESLGFIINHPLYESLSNLNLFIDIPDKDLEILIMDSINDNNTIEFVKYLTDKSNKVSVLGVKNERFWLKNENEMEKSLVPVEDINTITDWINNL